MNNQVMDQVKKKFVFVVVVQYSLCVCTHSFKFCRVIMMQNFFVVVVVVNSSIIQSHIYKDIYITFNLKKKFTEILHLRQT